MSTTSYWLSSPATKIWLLFIVMACTTTWALTLYIHKPKPETRELNMEVVKATHDIAFKFCKSIGSKNFLAQSSGLEVQAGCAREMK